jgi:hypothetical protein
LFRFFAKNSGVGEENWRERERERERGLDSVIIGEREKRLDSKRELDIENCVQSRDGGGGCEVCYRRSGN